MNVASKIKSSKVWMYTLLILIKPIYQFFWEYFLNLEGKILYFLWFKKNKKTYFNFKNQDKLLISNDKNFKELAFQIRLACNETVLDISRTDIKRKNINDNVTNSGENAYKNNINYLLDQNIKKKIFNFACSEKMISTAARYLKVFPVLNRLEVYHNLPVKPDKKRGAMMWHRDDFGYKSLDLFLAITDINKENGPLVATNAMESLGVFAKMKSTIINAVSGERGKVSDKKFENYLKKKGKISLSGSIGSALFIDSFTAYHKGGHCLKNERLMLRISFTTPDAINLESNFNERFEHYLSHNKQSLEPKFFKYLIYKKKYFFQKIISKKNLLNFYRLMHYKIS